jgi:hypothetical protein
MPGIGRPFEKGHAGGPGRPKGSSRPEICRRFAEEEGFQKLIDIAKGVGYKVGTINGKFTEVGPSRELQFEALKLAIAYGYGKPTESVDLTSNGNTLYDWLDNRFNTETEDRDPAGPVQAADA